MEVVSLMPRHLDELKGKGALGYLTPYMDDAARARITGFKHAFAVEIQGETVAAGGLLEYWEHRAEAWAFFDPNCKEHFLKIHNAAKRFLKIVPMRRIEAVVDFDFAAGHRWVKLLGFELEAPRLRSYNINGRDASLYAKIKE